MSDNVWDKKYAIADYAYGKAPNQFLAEQLESLKPGKAIFVAEGEGRNAVYAATLGWEVVAFDTSKEGKKKADALAKEYGVEIDYRVGEFEEVIDEDEKFDLGVFIFAHLPQPDRGIVHREILCQLKPGGHIIFEGFSVNHLNYRKKNPKAGGPGEMALLMDENELSVEFYGLKDRTLESKAVKLDEGLYHKGIGHVTRLTGKK